MTNYGDMTCYDVRFEGAEGAFGSVALARRDEYVGDATAFMCALLDTSGLNHSLGQHH